MKIAIISSYGVYCGIARYTYHLAEKLIRQKQEVVIFARYKESREKYEKDLKKLPLKIIRCWKNKCNKEKIKKELLRENPDIIHIQDVCRDEKIYKEIHKLFPKKIILTLHSVGAPKVKFHNVPKISDKAFVNKIKKYVACYIVHNNLSKEFLVKKNKIPKNKVFVIDHGTLACQKISQKKAREKLGLCPKKTILLTYGFFGNKKGILEVIKILPALLKKIPDIYYLHIGRKRLQGKDKYHKKYKKILNLIKKNNLKNKVGFVWKYFSEKETQLYFRAADLIILFYLKQGPLLHSSGVAHQMISCQKPIIASKIKTFSEFPEKSMYKIPCNLSMLEKSITKVLANKKLQKSLIENALQYSKASSWENTIEKHLIVYKKLKSF